MKEEFFFCDYNWMERKILAWEPHLRTLGITDIVAVARGGIFPATVLGFALDLPKIHLLNVDRYANRLEEQYHRRLTSESVVLLCEDVAGDGQTLVRCLQHVQQQAGRVYSLTINHFNGSTIVPDFSEHFGDKVSVFPWERFRINPVPNQEYKVHRRLTRPDSAYYKYGCDLDGIFLPDVDEALYIHHLAQALEMRASLMPFAPELFPPIDMSQAIIITARPMCDREVTQQWLAKHHITHRALCMRDPAIFEIKPHDDSVTKAGQAAHVKAYWIEEHAITHYFESDPTQATLIAAMLPYVRVVWWNNQSKTRMMVSAEGYRAL